MINYTSIENYLSESDPILKGLIERFGLYTNREIIVKQTFDSLVGTVISQMLSSSASSKIKKRLESLTSGRPFKPQIILNLGATKIKECGLSNSKIKTILALAYEANQGNLDLEIFTVMSDEEVIDFLKSFWGIGQWTTEIFLMFTLNRKDILPSNDAGLKRAHSRLYPTASILAETAECWRPYRSIACWYLWKYIDN